MCTCMYVYIFVCYAFLRDGASSLIPMIVVWLKETLSMQSMGPHCQDTFHYHIVHSLQLLQIVSFPLLLSSSIPSICNVGRIMGDPLRNIFFSCTAHIRMESSFLSLIISPINVTSSQPWGLRRKKCYPTESSPSISCDFPGSPMYMTLFLGLPG